MRRFARLYGAGPLHLIALTASLAIAGAAIVRWFDAPGAETLRVLLWFAGAILVGDFVLLPLYSLLDRIASGALTGRCAKPPTRPPGWVYVRVPALLSGLLGLVFLPEILRLGTGTFHAASGLGQGVYLERWLAASAAFFAVAGVVYAVRLARGRRSGDAPPE